MKKLSLLAAATLCVFSCAKPASMDVIFDTDANNELDDQHAIAYLLMNPETFNVKGITTNATHNGGLIAEQSKEAQRVIDLCGKYGKDVVLKSGAQADFQTILPTIGEPVFDASDAVNHIVETARAYSPEKKLVIIAVGKLTNVALAYAKAPEIIPNVRLVWLGSNYPAPGEYNLVNDIPAMNYILDTDGEFEIVTVRGREPSGTDAVRVSKNEVEELFAGKGPKVAPVEGRHGGEFTCFGDYSVNLFGNINLRNNTRALFDMAAVAVVKNPAFAGKVVIPAPTMVDGVWVERPDNTRTISIWEHFDRDAIVADFVATLER